MLLSRPAATGLFAAPSPPQSLLHWVLSPNIPALSLSEIEPWARKLGFGGERGAICPSRPGAAPGQGVSAAPTARWAGLPGQG